MKKIVLVLFAYFLCLNFSFAANAVELNIASFNIRLAPTPDVGNWQVRGEDIKNLVRFHDFDIFGIQEGWLHQNDLIKSDDFVYEYIADPREDGKTEGETCAIFYKPAKYEVILNGRFWLSETPTKPSLGWDAKHKRVCTWAKFKDKASGKNFFVFNVHFDHIGTDARQNSAILMTQRVKSIAGNNPFFLIGDFNLSANTSPILYLLANGFRNARNVSKTPPYGPDETFHNFTNVTLAKHKDAIDFIFISPTIEIEKFGVLTDRLSKLIKDENPFASKDENASQWSKIRTPSDHYPIVARAVIK